MPNDISLPPADRDLDGVLDTTSKPGDYYLYAHPEVLELMPLTAREVVDIGCGAGTLSSHLQTRQAMQLHGVELVELIGDWSISAPVAQDQRHSSEQPSAPPGSNFAKLSVRQEAMS